MFFDRALSWRTHTIVIFFSMLLCGLIAIHLGKEVDYDLANYHYYIAYAFLNGRWNIDYWPASNFPMYLNPTLDLFTYFLINSFQPIATTFCMGALHGLNVWLTFCICYGFVQQDQENHITLYAVILALMGMGSAITYSEIGSFIGDNTLSIFVLASILCFLMSLQNLNSWNDLAKRYLILSGFLLGASVGLKLTAALFGLGFVLSTIILPISLNLRIRILLLWSLASLAGFLITYGHWMLFLWTKFHNPFFPFFNNIFAAQGFPVINWKETRYFPTTWIKTILFPFYFSWDGKTADRPFQDFRFAVVYIVLMLSLIKSVVNTLKKSTHIPKNIYRYWILTFFVVSYVIWQMYFSNIRYMVPLQILCPLIIYLCILYLVTDKILQLTILGIIFVYLILTLQPLGYERVGHFGKDFFNIRLSKRIANVKNATVFIPYPKLLKVFDPWPVNFILPSLPKTWKFVGVPFDRERYEFDETTLSLMQNINNYLLTTPESMPQFIEALRPMGFIQSEPCEVILSDRYPHGSLLCKVDYLAHAIS